MRPRVLITRPEPGASRTAARLEAAGYEPVILPLTRIEPLNFAIPDAIFDAAVITSAQALKSVSSGPIRHIPVYAVGATTAEAARMGGFPDIITAAGSAGSVAALVQSTARPLARLLYLCGKVRRPELEAALGLAGFEVTAVETYDALPLGYAQNALAGRLGQTPFDAVALMSAQSAQLFSPLATKPEFTPLFKSSAIVCFSTRIGDALPAAMKSNTIVTNEATEDALMNCLARRFF